MSDKSNDFSDDTNESDEFITVDIDSINKNNKDKEDYEKEIKKYPVLGDDKNIFEIRSGHSIRRFFSNFSDLFSKSTLNKLVPKFDIKDKLSILKNKKKEDEFILEGFEGVYYHESSKIDKKKIYKYFFIALGIILFSLVLLFAGKFVINYFTELPSDVCPHECCINESYPNKLCPGFSQCHDNVCILSECPAHYECCSGIMYSEKACESEFYTCNQDFECVQKECPYACCTPNDNYKVKECINGGNCVNNECFLEPCPYECCIDEIDYNNQYCSDNEICINNECKSRIFEQIKIFFNIFWQGFRFLFG